MGSTIKQKSMAKEVVQVTVYADLNCPYCHVLNERLEQRGLSTSVSWLPVEHAPDLYNHSFTELDRQELIHEVDDVAARAPEVSIILPATRPNSRQASKLLATILRQHPDKAVEFRTAVYRALWQQGADISDPEVLDQLLVAIGLPNLQATSAAEDDLLSWHSAWERGQFARNIPSMESSAGFKMLGFPPRKQLEQFLKYGWVKVSNFEDAACVSSERYSIAVLSEAEHDWPQPKLLDAVTHYHFFTSAEQLITPVAGLHALDMIMLNDSRAEAINIIKSLKHSPITQYVPLFLLSDDEQIQVEAYRCGVTDIAGSHISEEILGHRMVRILRTKRSIDKLFRIARIDSLTGLYNRREFDAALDREWRQSQREKTALSLLMIDLDHFKAYNDTYGHSMGDEVLRRFARILESCTNRPIDLAVRYGGEEFAVILPNVDIEGAKHVARLICEQTEKHDIKHSTSTICPHITVSIGVAEARPASDMSMAELINQADKALYEAKEKGRNQVCIYLQGEAGT